MREVMMRMTKTGWVSGSGRWRALRVGAVALAAAGVVGAVPTAVASASPQQAPNWSEQAPATSPIARGDGPMAYDAATGTVVLFGGDATATDSHLGDTWTWNGTTWTKQTPATHPRARFGSAMAYDAATGTVVLFGGCCRPDTVGIPFDDTWTWNGTTWTEQSPATSPPARLDAAMAYDAATGTVVLFGGDNKHGYLGDTWTWNGTTWTEQSPATSPPARSGAAMAYDAATGTVVLFGGYSTTSGYLSDTWTWNGTTWTKQSPAAHPAARDQAYMAYDAATGTVVLFGGYSPPCLVSDTWTWNGTTWTKQTPATSPRPRALGAMAYDAATGNVVLFGGYYSTTTSCNPPNVVYPRTTWTWG
jgi:Kelch motif